MAVRAWNAAAAQATDTYNQAAEQAADAYNQAADAAWRDLAAVVAAATAAWNAAVDQAGQTYAAALSPARAAWTQAETAAAAQRRSVVDPALATYTSTLAALQSQANQAYAQYQAALAAAGCPPGASGPPQFVMAGEEPQRDPRRPGIFFDASISAGASGGRAQWVQVLTTTEEASMMDGRRLRKQTSEWVLDAPVSGPHEPWYPPERVLGSRITTWDSPSNFLWIPTPGVKEFVRRTNYRMYLVWRPHDNGIYVPLARIDWFANWTVRWDSEKQTWQLIVAEWSAAPVVQQVAEFPLWSRTISDFRLVEAQ